MEKEIQDTLKECLALFAPGHALSQFDWGKSCLSASSIRELNELPGKIKDVLKRFGS